MILIGKIIFKFVIGLFICICIGFTGKDSFGLANIPFNQLKFRDNFSACNILNKQEWDIEDAKQGRRFIKSVSIIGASIISKIELPDDVGYPTDYKSIIRTEWHGKKKLDFGYLKNLIELVTGEMGIKSDGLTRLLLGTCATETEFGKAIRSRRGGTDSGVFQILLSSAKRIEYVVDKWDNYKRFRPFLNKYRWGEKFDHEVRTNLRYQIALVSIYYLVTTNDKIPQPQKFKSKDAFFMKCSRVWKHYYNTSAGAGSMVSFYRRSKKYAPELWNM